MLTHLLAYLAAASLIEEPAQWNFHESQTVCNATLTNLSGTTLVFEPQADGEELVNVYLTNPAWKLEIGASKELNIRYKALPYRKPNGEMSPPFPVDEPPTLVKSIVIQGNVGTEHRSMLMFSIGARTFKTYIDGSYLGVRISVFYGDRPLTDWIRLNDAIVLKLKSCVNPFK